ncbi:hypothetical protein K9N68_01880 [Kovacikia minuta CCNUW1]|uniref:hypothetical protein n=1 Tax=Kovacikia minuta TaxID=2931930 RepID=UPI001CCB689F|nr:hypothetical protein [Kovacikia minuta]UBF26772.1 hypothetical protein K9N68_01880 [Kovacikia minuta CCNUW1]
MLTHHRRPVCLSLISTDFPICTEIETIATLYPKEQERYHLLLTEPVVRDREFDLEGQENSPISLAPSPRLLWLEFSPYRATMTMQGNGQFSYRHLLERGIYGISRYWLHSENSSDNRQLCLRNYTRNLVLEGKPLPHYLRIEYELWSERTKLGNYVVNLEIHH